MVFIRWSHPRLDAGQFLMWACLLTLAGCSRPTGPSSSPDRAEEASPESVWFEDVAVQRGLVFVHDSGYRTEFLFPETACGGAALFDMDGDGDLDAYLVQAGNLLDAPKDRRGNQLFRNDGKGYFTNVTASSGTEDRGYGMGVAAGDYDNDGDNDLYVSNLDTNALLRNDGEGRFTDVAKEAGVALESYGASTAFLDYDRDGDLDLFVANYLVWSAENEQICYSNRGDRTYGGPNLYSPAPDTLLRNEGDGTFTDISREAGLLEHFGNGLGVVCGDFNDDGWIDIYVANDMTPNQLWINQQDGTFRDIAAIAGCSVAETGAVKAGMGANAEDLDRDGDLDLLVVNLSAEPDSFFRNEGNYFVDRTPSTGLSLHSPRHTRFGAGLADFNNDGYPEFFVATGRINHDLPPIGLDTLAEPNLLYKGGPGPRFELIQNPPGGIRPHTITTSRAAAFGDVDGDGGIDILLLNRDLQASLLHNIVANRGNWVGLRVVERHGRDALGAVLRVRIGDEILRRDVKACYSYCSSNDPRVHIGLGKATQIDSVHVLWPTGEEEDFGPFAANQTHTLRQTLPAANPTSASRPQP